MNENGITFVEVPVSNCSDRTIKVQAIRNSTQKIQKNLTPDLLQASRDIDQAIDDLGKGFGYALVGMKVMDVTRTKGGAPTEEAIDKSRARIGRLHEWEFQCTKMGKRNWRDTVIALNQTEHTGTSFAKHIQVSVKTIMQWYRKGLNEYCILQGWGDQL